MNFGKFLNIFVVTADNYQETFVANYEHYLLAKMTSDTKPIITKIELGEIQVGINQQPTRRQSADFSESGDIALLTQLCQNHATYVLCLLYSLNLCTALVYGTI